MPDFSKYTNYTPDTAFSGVVFGAQAPVLEVELNAVQEIFNTKLRLLSSVVGGNLLIPSDGSVTYNPAKMILTLTNCVVVSDGFIVQIPNSQVTLSSTNIYAYLRLEEKTVDGQAVLKYYGNTAGKTITNPIIDARVGVETSRRKVINFTLQCGPTLPKSSGDVHFVKIGTLLGNEFRMENLISPIAEVIGSVNEVNSQLKNALIKGEVSNVIVLSENSNEALTTDGVTPLEATVYLSDSQKILVAVNRIIDNVVLSLRAEFQHTLETYLMT